MFGHNLLGKYIVFEGGEGCGKTTQQKLLVERLKKEFPAREIILTREPGGTPKAEEIRSAIFNPTEGEITLPLTEVFLYAASRYQNIEKNIRPALEKGSVVVSDRSFLSSLVYQGMARKVGWQRVLRINKEALAGVTPDLIVLPDIDPKVGLERKNNGNESNRFEREKLEFHQKVRKGYLFFANKFKEEILLVDGNLSIEEQAEIIWKRVSDLVSGRN